ncbi:muscle M-line assembly protein unc-89 Uncoordinated protein 89 [Paenibacillus sp. CMAA1739]|uniref:muscle M-line assembly protein unc-89 Uncoordinated protein 89 n=1 Tax=Paenibacillus ottowii TaxID=2315729 RepID=UPI00272F77D9|nr:MULTISPECIES: muscle M-line assembly protein unc-89 Uncoordinated protein 89 [Paenibacillus]MDP1512274.1 muscle M-line assembly protein unc-89 Uncoordinated protein 89 [Paenibacillus ottowii]MEC4567621.1 muscle M-line assembly protein unc-89 Uncoordinated protein 89 [Paenibacillus sp. CMAA1739]
MNVSFTSSHQSPFRTADNNRLEIRHPLSAQSERKSIAKPQNKIIQQLTEQKQSLMERRSDYVSNALKRGLGPEAVKAEMEEIDKQIQQIDENIQKQSLKEQKKALGMDEDSKKEAQEGKREQYTPKTAEEQRQNLIAYTMHGIVSAHNELKNAKISKMAQITLESEAKGWENTNPSRSTALREKAEGLDGKIMAIAANINERISEAVNNAPSIIEQDQPKGEKEANPEAGRVWTEQEINAYQDSANKETKTAGTKVNIAV